MTENSHPATAPHKLPILVAGPTGSGKTSFAVALAQRVGGEIVCADAFQIYRGMPALTAQPGVEEQMGIPHHLFGCLDPSQPFDVADWRERAETLIREISGRGATPILVGGTGLYLKAFTHGLDPAPAASPGLRKELGRLPLPELRERLAKADPQAILTLDLQNSRRVQRALEIVLSSGRPLADFRSMWSRACRPLAASVWLSRQRDDLRARIAANVGCILDRGAVEEVQFLRGKIDGFPAAGAIGFKEISAWLDGHGSYEECRANMTVATCQYARRQETWFRRLKEMERLPVAPGASLQTLAEEIPLGSLSISPEDVRDQKPRAPAARPLRYGIHR